MKELMCLARYANFIDEVARIVMLDSNSCTKFKILTYKKLLKLSSNREVEQIMLWCDWVYENKQCLIGLDKIEYDLFKRYSGIVK